ncbi:hypothetical protein HZB78_01750 [Candidatus Collierbacteria bacterium]|nr:hypothetical protein [Candidatus Collierbacteria bacterium]
MKPDLGSIFTPFFWITITFLSLTYGPVLVGRLKGEIKSSEVKQQLIDRSPQPIKAILGDQTQSLETNSGIEPVKPAGQISTYVRNVIDDATKAVIDKGSSQLEETKQQTTSIVCKQIITEVQKQCGIE